MTTFSINLDENITFFKRGLLLLQTTQVDKKYLHNLICYKVAVDKNGNERP